MIVLFEHPLSPYAQKVKIALAEKAVPFESRLPDLLGGDPGEFLPLNPRLEVPTLLDGEVAVFDSTIILEYVEERWPNPPLLPVGAAERARVRMLEELCDTYYEAINWAIFEIRVFQRASGISPSGWRRAPPASVRDATRTSSARSTAGPTSTATRSAGATSP